MKVTLYREIDPLSPYGVRVTGESNRVPWWFTDDESRALFGVVPAPGQTIQVELPLRSEGETCEVIVGEPITAGRDYQTVDGPGITGMLHSALRHFDEGQRVKLTITARACEPETASIGDIDKLDLFLSCRAEQHAKTLSLMRDEILRHRGAKGVGG